jgi:hypothetical protein
MTAGHTNDVLICVPHQTDMLLRSLYDVKKDHFNWAYTRVTT